MDTPKFQFAVECKAGYRVNIARFTNEKHAKKFLKTKRREGIFEVRMFEINSDGTLGKEIKIR